MITYCLSRGLRMNIVGSSEANSAPSEFAFSQWWRNTQNNLTMLTLLQNKQITDGNYRWIKQRHHASSAKVHNGLKVRHAVKQEKNKNKARINSSFVETTIYRVIFNISQKEKKTKTNNLL